MNLTSRILFNCLQLRLLHFAVAKRTSYVVLKKTEQLKQDKRQNISFKFLQKDESV